PSGGSEPTTAQRATTGEPRVAPAPVAPRRTLVAVVGVVAVIAAAGLGWWATHRGAAPSAASASAGAAKTIAVLPFSSGRDTAADYFSDGISDEVRTELTKVAGLTVSA